MESELCPRDVFVVFPTFTNQGTATSDDERTVNILISLLFSFSLVFYSHSFPFQGICRSASALCGLGSHDSVMTDHVWVETELLFMNEMCCLR